jgi:hypothetical protein
MRSFSLPISQGLFGILALSLLSGCSSAPTEDQNQPVTRKVSHARFLNLTSAEISCAIGNTPINGVVQPGELSAATIISQKNNTFTAGDKKGDAKPTAGQYLTVVATESGIKFVDAGDNRIAESTTSVEFINFSSKPVKGTYEGETIEVQPGKSIVKDVAPGTVDFKTENGKTISLSTSAKESWTIFWFDKNGKTEVGSNCSRGLMKASLSGAAPGG